jgi:hypothetical protein
VVEMKYRFGVHAVSLALYRDLPLRPRYCHMLSQGLDHFLGGRSALFSKLRRCYDRINDDQE